LLEETACDPANEILNRSLLLGRMRPADLNAQPKIEHYPGEHRIPLRDFAVLLPRERHRLRPIKDGEQGNAAHRGEVVDQRARQDLDLFIRHDGDLDPARVLEARGEEVHALLGPVEKPHAHLTEIVLCELTRETLEAHDGPRREDAHATHQLIQRTLGTVVAGELRATQ